MGSSKPATIKRIFPTRSRDLLVGRLIYPDFMPNTDHDRVVALAGVMQAAHLVRSIARTGQLQADEFATCMYSLLQIEAPNTLAVYGGEVQSIHLGLRLLEQQLRNPQDVELTRYVVTLLRLERTLNRREDLLNLLRRGIEEVLHNLAHFPVTHSNTVARFADLYLKTVSILSPRIVVTGVQVHLTNPENANRIRALLLAGIRSARLWRQCGGSRWGLLLRRNTLLRETRFLLAQLK